MDLSCELLAVAASLPEPPEPAVTEDAWRRVAAAQHTCGAVPEEGAFQDAAPPARDDPSSQRLDHSDARDPCRRRLATARREDAEHAGQGVPG
ncbi:DUF6895 family protein [Streptomyces sp. DHE17-7]|uniref:DUF6895 family protein n=1 Tax=Streptomyces sp. DHE17-7 TaxID=2759949 RepID=UPI003FA6EDBA